MNKKESTLTWDRLGARRTVCQTPVFSLHAERLRSPSGEYEGDFYFMECFDWVNIVPITENSELILIRQHRHGVDNITLEIPGGTLDENDDDPLTAAKRELTEETGFSADSWHSLGWVHPNPAIQRNRCHFFAAIGARQNGRQQLDPAEAIEVVKVPIEKLSELATAGAVTHSLVLCAFFRLLLSPLGKELGLVK